MYILSGSLFLGDQVRRRDNDLTIFQYIPLENLKGKPFSVGSRSVVARWAKLDGSAAPTSSSTYALRVRRVPRLFPACLDPIAKVFSHTVHRATCTTLVPVFLISL